MKTKRLFIGIAASAALLVLSHQRSTAPKTSPPRATPEPSKISMAQKPRTNAPASEPASEPAAEPVAAEPYAPPQRVTAQLGDHTLSFMIDPEYLKEAEQRYREIMLDEDEQPPYDEQVETVSRYFDLHSASNVICLRLAANPETAELIGLILSEFPKLEAQRLVLANQQEQQAQRAAMVEHKDALVAVFAIESMLDENDAEPSPEQEMVIEQAGQWFETLSEEWEGDTAMRPWYANQGVLETLSTVLTPAQFEELLTYRAEKEHREIERDAYYRSLWVAQETGLNENDRAALFEYLQDHPKTTDEEIQTLLAPELRALMPRRGCGTCF